MPLFLKRIGIVGLFIVFGMLLASCGPAQPPDDVTEEASEEELPDNTADGEELSSIEPEETEPEAPTLDGAFDIFNGADEDDFTTTDSGLQYLILEEGDGPFPEPGQVVSVHYTGYLTNGTKFDSSHDRGQAFGFPLGMGQVIAGWDEGVAQLPVGSKARLIIPAELGYGDSGAGSQIPPGATLVFDVDLIDILPPPPESPTEVDESDFTVTESGVKYYDIEEGDGRVPNLGEEITVHYTGWLEDGTRFDSSLLQGQPIPFVLGIGQVIPGWDEGFAGMKVGGMRQMVIPPELAFGEVGAGGGLIPPNATLIFEMELLDVSVTE